MRGLPVIFILIVVVNIVVRVIKAANESRQSDDNWKDSDDDSDWSDWTAGNTGSKPSTSYTPPAPPVSRPSPSPLQQRRTVASAAASQTAPAASNPRARTLQEMLRDVQRAVEAPKASTPSKPSPAHAKSPAPQPPPAPVEERKSVFKNMSKMDGPPADAGDLPDSELMPYLNAQANALDAAFTADTLNEVKEDRGRSLRLKIRGKRDLRRSVLVREILDRPRAFDM